MGLKGKYKEIYEGYVNKGLSMMNLMTVEHELIAQQRLEICKECPNLDNGKCKLCGCVMTVKVHCLSCECPDTPKKWDKE